MTLQPPMVITCGETASIAPEITAKAWAALRRDSACAFFLIADAADFIARTQAVGLSVPVVTIDTPEEARKTFERALPILHVPLPKPSRAAWIDTRNSNFVIDVIKAAAAMCLDARASAMITNPIQKDALYAVGFKYQGHTDFLAAVSRNQGLEATDVMMLVAQDLRAVPITVHVPLKDVPIRLTETAIVEQGIVVAKALQKYFGVASPRLAVTGLNPHAGENGAMGDEERLIIEPAINTLRMMGIAVTGPLPADTSFHAEARATYDAILCMYHDQALIPVKTLDFHGGVNVTLGLPFIRTSPDHGTALNLAGTGMAKPDSLIAAITQAAQMAKQA